MGEKLRRDRGAAGKVLGAGDRRDERANVRDNAEFTLIKKSLELGKVGVKSEIATVAVLQGERKQRCLGEREYATRSRVGSVAAGIVRDDDVVGVVAAEKKKANEGF